MKLIIAAVCIISLSACSSTGPTSPSEENFSAQSVEVHMSRSSLGASEFENVKLFQDKLFKECGSLRYGRFIPQTQDLVPVQEENKEEILQLTQRLLAEIEQGAPSLPEAGDNRGLFDPGVFHILITSNDGNKEIRTSLDSVSEPKNRIQKRLRELARSLRKAAGGELCGNKEFYGL